MHNGPSGCRVVDRMRERRVDASLWGSSVDGDCHKEGIEIVHRGLVNLLCSKASLMTGMDNRTARDEMLIGQSGTRHAET